MTKFFKDPKDPSAVLDYQVDWTLWLNGDTLSGSSWTADPGLTIDSSSYTDTEATVWVSGGTPGATYKVTNHITTVAGRTDERTLYIPCNNR